MTEIGRLASMLERHPERRNMFGVSTPGADVPDPHNVIGQVSNIPLEMSNVAQDLGLPLSEAIGRAGGIYNGNFHEGPEDGTGSTVDDTGNKLPGWTFDNSSGTNITCQWDDSDRVTFVPAVGTQTNEWAYIETIVPVLQIGRVLNPRVSIVSIAQGPVRLQMQTQFLDIDGGTAGSAGTLTSYQEYSIASPPPLEQWRTPRWGDEAFIRIRVGLLATGVTTVTSNIIISDVSLLTPFMNDITMHGVRSTWDPSSGSNYDIRTTEEVAFGAGYHVATSDGFLLGFSGLTTANITAGKARVYVRNATKSTNISATGTGAGTYFDSSNSKIAIERLLENAPSGGIPYDFEYGDKLRFRVETTSSYAGGSGDWYFTAHLMQVLGRASSGWSVAS